MSEIKNEHLYGVLRAPHVSEKSARLAEHNQYVFEVAANADKQQVKAAVARSRRAHAASRRSSTRKCIAARSSRSFRN